MTGRSDPADTASIRLSVGEFSGEFSRALDAGALLGWLQTLPDRVRSPEARLLHRLRNRIHAVACPPLGPGQSACSKWFARPGLLRSLWYSRIGSKAARTFRHAVHLHNAGVGVPQPIGYHEQWKGRRLVESYYLSRYEDGISDLYSEMAWLLREHPDCERFLALLQTAAEEISRMHACGFMHNDLGGQNILLRRGRDSSGRAVWGDVRFIDLNRGRILPALTHRQRARDLAKLEIPSHLRRIFFHIYFGNGPIPGPFRRWERFYRARITLHNESRKLRHPIREWLLRHRQVVQHARRPDYRDMWLWDEKAGQPSVILDSPDRRKYRSSLETLALPCHGLRILPRLWAGYRRLRRQAYAAPVDMANRIGISIEVLDDWEQRRRLLEGLEGVPVFVRCYFHKGRAGIGQCARAVGELARAGHEVALGLVQSRAAVLDPAGWGAFVEAALERMHRDIRHVEIGHAVNRTKWGIWNNTETEGLWQACRGLRARYPHLTVLGPAVNDFEYYRYPPLLRRVAGHMDGLSCHLYVDRRGAPENFQGPFSLLEKCVLGRAMAEAHGLRGFYVTETNWPLAGTGVYSPISCPYLFPGKKESHLHVDERTYAAYLIRYYLIALCSGMCERVWWWRLASHGFGLADDIDAFRRRPAWHALATLHRVVGNAVFLRREERDGCIVFTFDTAAVAYAPQPAVLHPPPGATGFLSMTGEPVTARADGAFNAGPEPLFWRHDPSP